MSITGSKRCEYVPIFFGADVGCCAQMLNQNPGIFERDYQFTRPHMSQRSGFILQERFIRQVGSLKFETVKISKEGGCHYGQWNR
jgi:hypothetical protein